MYTLHTTLKQYNICKNNIASHFKCPHLHTEREKEIHTVLNLLFLFLSLSLRDAYSHKTSPHKEGLKSDSMLILICLPFKHLFA